jgi:hypothetical protein
MKNWTALLFLCILTMICLIGCDSLNQPHSTSSTIPSTPVTTSSPTPTEQKITVSGLDFNIDSFKGTDDYNYVQIVFNNLLATIKKDHDAFAKTFLPDVNPKTYEYVMNQIERYKKIERIDKDTDQVNVLVRYERPSTTSLTINEATNRSYILRKNASGDWLLYTID